MFVNKKFVNEGLITKITKILCHENLELYGRLIYPILPSLPPPPPPHTHTHTQAEDIHEYIDEIIFYIRDQFVDGKASTAKNLIMDSVIVTQNRHCIAMLDKASYGE